MSLVANFCDDFGSAIQQLIGLLNDFLYVSIDVYFLNHYAGADGIGWPIWVVFELVESLFALGVHRAKFVYRRVFGNCWVQTNVGGCGSGTWSFLSV